MRLFVGLEVTGPARCEVLRVQAALREVIERQGVRFVAPDKLHLTLAFLGTVRDEAIPDLRHSLADLANVGDFEARLDDLGAFPNRERPKVIWIGVDGASGLTGLADQVARMCRPFAPELDSRPFSPHLTLARIKPGSRQVGTILAQSSITPEPLSFPITEVLLVHSRSDGVYQPLDQVRLSRREELSRESELPTS